MKVLVLDFLIRQNICIKIKVTVRSPINEHSKNWTALIKGKMLFSSHKSNSLVLISKRRTLPISGKKSIPEFISIVHKISDKSDNN